MRDSLKQDRNDKEEEDPVLEQISGNGFNGVQGTAERGKKVKVIAGGQVPYNFEGKP